MTEPTPWGIHRIGDIYDPEIQFSADGKTWHLAVAEPYTGNKLKAAWWVLTGKAYAFKWPKPGDLEKVLGPDTIKQRYKDSLSEIARVNKGKDKYISKILENLFLENALGRKPDSEVHHVGNRQKQEENQCFSTKK